MMFTGDVQRDIAFPGYATGFSSSGSGKCCRGGPIGHPCATQSRSLICVKRIVAHRPGHFDAKENFPFIAGTSNRPPAPWTPVTTGKATPIRLGKQMKSPIVDHYPGKTSVRLFAAAKDAGKVTTAFSGRPISLGWNRNF